MVSIHDVFEFHVSILFAGCDFARAVDGRQDDLIEMSIVQQRGFFKHDEFADLERASGDFLVDVEPGTNIG